MKRRPYTVQDWRDWSAYLATIPADRNQGERDRWRAAFAVAVDALPDTDPMWMFFPHDWTPRDIEIRVDAYAASNARYLSTHPTP